MSTLKFTVSSQDAGKRLDKFLAENSEASRSYIQKLLQEDGQNPSRKVTAGEELELEIPEAEPLNLDPWDFPLNIIFENDDLIVLNKPVGLTVHPAPGNYTETLVHALLHHCKGQLSGINGVERPGIVHRLDKDTSGVMVVAKTDEAHKRLAGYIESREMQRIYRAVVCGVPNPMADIIETAYGRHPKDRKKMTVYEFMSDDKPNIKEAITEYKVSRVLYEGKASVVECKLQTGRTHQIRVHMKHLGYPIVGDQVYGSVQDEKALPQELKGFKRQMLHAYKLIIPDVGEFEATLPEDMKFLDN